MTANQRRPGFRLPWSSESDETADEAPSGTPSAQTDAGAADAGAAGGATNADTVGAPATGGETTPAATWADAEPAAPRPDPGTPRAAEPAAPAGPAAPAARDLPAPSSGAAPASQAPASVTPGPEGRQPEQAARAPEPTGAASVQPAAAEASPDEFLRDLVAAMRRVADEARQAGVGELKARADEQIRRLEADAERRREEVRARAETDVAAVGEWAKAEAERIKQEAEQRVAARRAQLDQQLAGDTTRTEAETTAVRERVADYERELDAYHAQLLEINDPAAFAAAAKRMPKPPTLTGVPTPATAPNATTAPTTGGAGGSQAPVEPRSTATNGVPGAATDASAPSASEPAAEEALAARLAQLDERLPRGGARAPTPDATGSAAAAAAAESDQTATGVVAATTEVVVKGLGSFGAITGFRQALAGVNGVDAVALSLGQTGEFVFRATHAPGFDLRGAIATLEGDAARIVDRPEGGLLVTLERAR